MSDKKPDEGTGKRFDLGELLVAKGLLTPAQLETARAWPEGGDLLLDERLTRLKYLTDEQLRDFLSERFGVPALDLEEFEVDPDVLKLLPDEFAWERQALPINRAGATLVLALANPCNITVIADVEFITGYRVEVVVARESALQGAIARYYSGGRVRAYREKYGTPYLRILDFRQTEIAAEVLKLVPNKVARERRVVPVFEDGRTLMAAMCDPTDRAAIAQLEFLTGLEIEVVGAFESDLARALEKYYPD